MPANQRESVHVDSLIARIGTGVTQFTRKGDILAGIARENFPKPPPNA